MAKERLEEQQGIVCTHHSKSDLPTEAFLVSREGVQTPCEFSLGYCRYGFVVYQDPTVTDIACAGLNGMRMGERTLTVRRATEVRPLSLGNLQASQCMDGLSNLSHGCIVTPAYDHISLSQGIDSMVLV